MHSASFTCCETGVRDELFVIPPLFLEIRSLKILGFTLITLMCNAAEMGQLVISNSNLDTAAVLLAGIPSRPILVFILVIKDLILVCLKFGFVLFLLPSILHVVESTLGFSNNLPSLDFIRIMNVIRGGASLTSTNIHVCVVHDYEPVWPVIAESPF